MWWMKKIYVGACCDTIMKRLRIGYCIRGVYWCVIIGLVVFFVEFLFFYSVLTRSWDVEEADLIAVFAGSEDRVGKGYDLASAGVASLLCISPRSEKQYRSDVNKYGSTDGVQFLVEKRAVTTFQNALLVGNLIKKNNVMFVVLVTNSAHMPRSCLLFKTILIGKDVKIIPCPVEDGAFSKNPFIWSTRQKKKVYNEMVELWGSFFEFVQYKFRGKLPENCLKKSKGVRFLKSVLLFDV